MLALERETWKAVRTISDPDLLMKVERAMLEFCVAQSVSYILKLREMSLKDLRSEKGSSLLNEISDFVACHHDPEHVMFDWQWEDLRTLVKMVNVAFSLI